MEENEERSDCIHYTYPYLHSILSSSSWSSIMHKAATSFTKYWTIYTPGCPDACAEIWTDILSSV